MVTYPVLNISESQVKILFGQKTVIMPIFDHHTITGIQTCAFSTSFMFSFVIKLLCYC